MGTIIGSIIYIALVAYAVIKGDDAFAQCRPKKKDDMEAKLSAKHAAMRGDREKKQRNSMAMNNNPLLMKAAARYAADHDLGWMEWQTPDWNTGAIRFYERLGAVAKSKFRFSVAVKDLSTGEPEPACLDIA